MKQQGKKYWYNLQTEELEKIKAAGKRPSLLMHTCCAVCACWPIVYLSEHFDLDLFYYNDNIYPEEEYVKRLSELERYVEKFNRESGHAVGIIKTPYDGENYLRQLAPLKDEPEGGKRCQLCYGIRMRAGMEYAVENNYDYFTTVMTISRQKDSMVLNRIGEQLQQSYPQVRYFFSDFKKDGGLEKGSEIVRENNIYRQNYCGCKYSYEEMLERAKKDYEK